MLKAPEEQCVVWMARSVYRYIPCETSSKRESDIRERILNLEI